jgi:hypothetical protein
MNALFRWVAWSLLLALVPAVSGAQTRFFIAGGPTGTSDFGFRGGFGGSIGIEHRIAEPASFLIRFDGAAVPSSGRVESFPASIMSLGQPSSYPDATLLSLMVGIRLGSRSHLSPYLDALAGVGYLNDSSHTVMSYLSPIETRSSAGHTNVALSFGPGIALRAEHMPALFADVHYDFYFSDGATTPIIPVRMGLLVP